MKGNISRVKTQIMLIPYPDEREEPIVSRFREKLGDNVDILSITVLYVASWQTIEGIQVPRRINYLCTYIDHDEES